MQKHFVSESVWEDGFRVLHATKGLSDRSGLLNSRIATLMRALLLFAGF